MWFQLPEGTNGISVERQQFECEIRDDAGRGYFRAPDHFAPRILSIPGFALANPPEGAPEDLPKSDPLRDGAIAQLSAENEALRMEMAGLRADLESARAQVSAAQNEAAMARQEVLARDKTIAELEDKIEDKG